jgi:RNA polymerase-binding transcription factor DksA
MAKFLTGNELNSELEKLFEKAEEHLILISPFIKLHDRYKSSLLTKKNHPQIAIVIVFGKNEDDMSKSMKQEDFNFFKEFPNLEIRYEKRLHAKYYANENFAIITSMNLYSFSQDNNIESGVKTKASIAGSLLSENNLDNDAWNYFERVIEQSELLFKRTPKYESAMLGLTKKYTESTIEIDVLSDFFSDRAKYDSKPHNKANLTDRKLDSTSSAKLSTSGYCIRTGKEIPFNTKQPMTDEAYKNWSKFGNKDYPEKFCHFSGEASNGETSFSKPIMRKNWKKAAETFKL